MRKSLIFFGVLTFISAGELFCRFLIGLGTPPLYQTDTLLEYRLKPNQKVYRFGNLIEVNERSMRSPTLVNEQRDVVLVLGDSVLYGGSQLDQSELATSLLSNAGILFANLSAGSWGPANITAALKESHDFKKTAIIVVLNSGDLNDVPLFGPLTVNQPEITPVSALLEGLMRYGPRIIENVFEIRNILPDLPRSEGFDRGDYDINEMLRLLKSREVPSCIVLHPAKSEFSQDGANSFEDLYIKVSTASLPFVDARLDSPKDLGALYLDDIHLTAAGQKWLSHSILDCLGKTQKNEY